MTLNEYIDKIKAENNITYETKDIANYIKDCARKQKEGDCAVLDNETVKNLIVTYDPSKAPKKEIKATVSSENKKSVEEIQKEAIAEAKKEEPKAEKPKKEEKQRDWEQTSLGFWNV